VKGCYAGGGGWGCWGWHGGFAVNFDSLCLCGDSGWTEPVTIFSEDRVLCLSFVFNLGRALGTCVVRGGSFSVGRSRRDRGLGLFERAVLGLFVCCRGTVVF